MRFASTNLKTHLAQQYQTLATCWRITLTNNTVFSFTSHDQNLVVDGVTYLAATGYLPTNIETTDALNVDQLEVIGMLTSGSLTENDLRAGLWDYADILIFLVNWANLSQGKIIQRAGKLGEISTGRGNFQAELRGLMQAYTRVIGELTQPTCRAVLGDHRCGVAMAPFTVTGTITGVDADNATLYDTSRTEPGPTGGYNILNIISVAPRAHILLDTPGVVTAVPRGFPVMLSGIVGPEKLNGLHIIRDPNSFGVSSDFYIDVDISDTGQYPAYVGSGIATVLGTESGWFDFGVITFTSGNNNGLSMEVRHSAPKLISLSLPMPYAVQVGDTYSLTAGCDQHLLTCINKFNNVRNFRGEPHLPGRDRVVQVGRRG